MEKQKLKPCPFCGNELIVRYDFGKHTTYGCGIDDCQVSVHADSEQEAFDKWNSRSTPQTINLRNEILKLELKKNEYYINNHGILPDIFDMKINHINELLKL